MQKINVLILLLLAVPLAVFATEEADYQAGVQAFNSGERLKAQGIFEKFVSDYPESQWTPHSIYHLGRLENDTQRALQLYQMIYQDYSKSDVADDALFEVAQYYYATAAYNTAIEKYRNLVSSYKKSEFACEAQYWMANALFATGAFDKALEEYRNVSVRFPGCDKIPQAELGLAQAHFRMGKFRNASVQYRTVLSEQSDPGVIASALYGLGECSERDAQIEQAIYSYEKLVQDFPTSQESAQAKIRLIELRKQYTPKRDVSSIKESKIPESQPSAIEKQTEEPAMINYTIQVGAFGQAANADKFAEELEKMGYDARTIKIDDNSAVPFKVRVGGFENRKEAEEIVSKLKIDSPDISTFILKIEK